MGKVNDNRIGVESSHRLDETMLTSLSDLVIACPTQAGTLQANV